jgi:hypothetical protein
VHVDVAGWLPLGEIWCSPITVGHKRGPLRKGALLAILGVFLSAIPVAAAEASACNATCESAVVRLRAARCLPRSLSYSSVALHHLSDGDVEVTEALKGEGNQLVLTRKTELVHRLHDPIGKLLER